jgi:hypothetical protein
VQKKGFASFEGSQAVVPDASYSPTVEVMVEIHGRKSLLTSNVISTLSPTSPVLDGSKLAAVD